MLEHWRRLYYYPCKEKRLILWNCTISAVIEVSLSRNHRFRKFFRVVLLTHQLYAVVPLSQQLMSSTSIASGSNGRTNTILFTQSGKVWTFFCQNSDKREVKNYVTVTEIYFILKLFFILYNSNCILIYNCKVYL